MIWAIILDYAIKGISVEELTAKEGLLLWCRKKTTGYKHIDPPGIQNFKGHWQNGLAFCALIHRHRPDLLDYSTLDPSEGDKNLELAFDIAEKHLGIPRLLEVADMSPVPDERSVMTYVSEYFHRFASQDQKETAARRCAKFLSFLRGMQQRQNEYETRAAAVIQFAVTSGQTFGEYKFGETLGDAQQALTDLRSFVVNTRPQQEGEKMDVESLFAEIQTELLVNDRKPYVPPVGLAPEDIEAAFHQLQKAERSHSHEARLNRMRFVTKAESALSEEKIEEFKASFRHFDANKSNTLDKPEFKAALSAMSVFFTSPEEFDACFAKVSEGTTSVSLTNYIQFLTSKYQDRDTAEQIKESFRAVAGGAGTISEAQLTVHPLGPQDAAFLVDNMPRAADGSLDYATFVDNQFSK